MLHGGMMNFNLKHALSSFIISLCLSVFLCRGQSNQVKTDRPAENENKSWFKIQLILEKVWRIDDHGDVNIYLVEGDDKALLIDTGNGKADLTACVKNITKLPVIVVNTHGHPDHVGGNFQFSQVFVHPADLNLTNYFLSKAYHEQTIQNAIKENPEFESSFIKSIDGYQQPEYVPVDSGYIFDLGNRKLEVIETPGHTPGSIVLLDAANRLLFSGDNNNPVAWLFLDGCLPLESYLKTLQKLNQRSEEFDNLLPGHGDVMDKSFINEQIICAFNIIHGNCMGKKYENPFVPTALQCTYKRATIAYNPDNIYLKH
jgi:glyoxylase-like metal-dependent hydrolase (beta-lactamase superfamily II)